MAIVKISKFLLFIIFSMMGVIFIRWVISLHPYYSFLNTQPTYQVQKPSDDTIRIICLGDSWISLHCNFDSILSVMISEKTHHPSKVVSIGLPRQTSKDVYKSLFSDSVATFFKEGADYCFISVGLNDAIQKLGSDYYIHHTSLIIEFLLSNEIHPILLELPDVDITNYFYKQTHTLLRNSISMFVSGCSINCLQEYRDAMNSIIRGKYSKKSVSIIPYKLWNNKGKHDWDNIYQIDKIHLNSAGYYRLDSVIAHTIQQKSI